MDRKVVQPRSRSCWSIIRKTQVVCGALGAFLTVVVLLLSYSSWSPPKYSFISNLYWSIGMLLVVPSVIIGRALGIAEGASHWIWNILELAVNTGISVAVGTVIGWVIRECKNLFSL